jgi:hypothetical protein
MRRREEAEDIAWVQGSARAALATTCKGSNVGTEAAAGDVRDGGDMSATSILHPET